MLIYHHTYALQDPQGNIHMGENIARLAKAFNLNKGCLQRVATGERPHHKGWKAVEDNK